MKNRAKACPAPAASRPCELAAPLHVAEPGPGDEPEGRQPAAVLTHPAFEREPVVQRLSPGRRPKAVQSLRAHRAARQTARNEAEARAQAQALASAPQPAASEGPPDVAHHFDGKICRGAIYDLVVGACSTLYFKPDPERFDAAEADIIEAAWRILDFRLRRPGVALAHPAAVRHFLALRLAARPVECFCVLFLDAQHALIAAEVMFEGTLTQTAVYPREVARRALELGANAVILSHNHPSGALEPSKADCFLTQTLKLALLTVDVRVLDHVIVGRLETVSMAERGML